MAIEALYRTIRSDARQLARRDSLAVIWAYSQFLQVNDFQMPQYIEVAQQLHDARPRQGVLAEWTLEHLAREIIRYSDEEARDGKTLRRWDTLAHLANTLRDLEGEIYRDLVGAPHIQSGDDAHHAPPVRLAAAALQLDLDHPLLQALQHTGADGACRAGDRPQHRPDLPDWHVLSCALLRAAALGSPRSGRDSRAE